MFISKLLPIFVGVLESNLIVNLIKRPMRIARTLFISEWIAEEGRKVSLPRFLKGPFSTHDLFARQHHFAPMKQGVEKANAGIGADFGGRNILRDQHALGE